MTLLQIVQLGQPILRQKAQAVADPTDPGIKTLITDLLATLTETNGVGLSAPQVFQSIRVLIVASRPNPRYPNAPHMEPTPMINPVLVNTIGNKSKDWEGCLSIPGIRGLVPRYMQIEIEYFDQTGTKQQKSFTDFIARIFQHELDHLDGILYIDRLETNIDLISEHEYQKRFRKT